MAAVDVGVGHRDDPVIAQLVVLETLADPGPQRSDQVPDLF